MKNLVIAVGGNALIGSKDHISINDQSTTINDTCSHIADLIADDYAPVITHGNGPQVGFLLRRAELAEDELPPLPLDVLGADTQGATGYLFARHLNEQLSERGIKRNIAAIVTQSVVDGNDPAFKDPSKPIGSFMDADEAKERQDKNGWDIREDSGRGFRRVVASPRPLEIIELASIKMLVEKGSVVIACGGGGIPVKREGNDLVGVEAVIDKDLASALLAHDLGVDTFAICTAVDQVCINFNTPEQKAIDTMTVAEAKKYLEDGQFGKGSMAPKIQAAIDFLEGGGSRVVITSLPSLNSAVKGQAGTTILQ